MPSLKEKEAYKFSPTLCEIYKINHEKLIVQQIKRIKNRFQFKHEYDLLQALEDAINWYHQEKSIMQQEPSVNESRIILNKLLNELNAAINIPTTMESCGTAIRGLLIDCLKETPNILECRKINVASQSILVDETLSNLEDGILRLKSKINRVTVAINKAIAKLPAATAGRRGNRSPTKRFIPILAKIYEDGTGKKPVCEWDRENEKIFSHCRVHLFIKEMAKILKRETGIDLGTGKSIEKNTKDFWREYRDRL